MFIIYIFEIPLFAVALVFAFLLGGKISEPLMVASIVAIAGMGMLMICSIVKFCKEIKDNGYEKIQWFIGIVISLMFIIAAIRLFGYAAANPALTVYDVLF